MKNGPRKMHMLAANARPKRNGTINTLQAEDQPIHGWYRFVLSFPPHLVRKYMTSFGLGSDSLLLDPFCGTGTTLVEAKKNRIPSVGCDAHPFAALVSRVKTNWTLDAKILRSLLKRIIKQAQESEVEHGLPTLSLIPAILADKNAEYRTKLELTEGEEKLLPTGFLSAKPLQRLLILRDTIDSEAEDAALEYREFFFIAFAYVIANGAGNFAFGPEIYRTKAKPDHDVLGQFALHSDKMIAEMVEAQLGGLASIPAEVLADDARKLSCLKDTASAVITSPPYPNEKDYTRTTRVESILLGLVTDRPSLREVKESLLRSNTRNIFVADKDAEEVKEFASIQRVCRAIERRRVELKKDSGFERLYHKVVAHYFGGMRKHFRALRPKLRKHAKLAYVVGDQLSFLMVPVATATLLSEVAVTEGFKVVGCDLWRERVGTKVRNSPTNERTVRVREEVLLLERT